MNNFKELGIKYESKSFLGDKIKVERVLNKEITVYDYKIEPSKFKGLCLHLQIQKDGIYHVIFTSSGALREMIQQISPEKFPFKTTIVKENGHFEFT